MLRKHQFVSEEEFDDLFKERDGKVFGRLYAHEPLIEIDVEAGTISFDDFPDGKFTIAV
ncbi:MAG: hypothetical protein AB7T40_08310 [Alphaproteobacteria bacterium]